MNDVFPFLDVALPKTVYDDIKSANICDALATPFRYPFLARDETSRSAWEHTCFALSSDTSSAEKADSKEEDRVSRSAEESS